jgi:hypothetical protein
VYSSFVCSGHCQPEWFGQSWHEQLVYLPPEEPNDFTYFSSSHSMSKSVISLEEEDLSVKVKQAILHIA